MTDSAVDPGAAVDPTATVDRAARVGPACRIGPSCTVASGAYLEAAVELGAGVEVGPNVAFVGRGLGAPVGDSEPIVVHDRVAIGANATVLGGVTIAAHAVVGAGAVVTRDVPPFAVVVGNPARIVGYASSSPAEDPAHQSIASALADDAFPLSIGRASLLRMPTVFDLRGALSYGEWPTDLPFDPVRYWLVYDVPSREVRGEHAHITLHELLVCVAGEVAVALDDGDERGEVVLDRRDAALYLPPMVWSRQYRFSADAVLLVLASERYEADDYLRDYHDFVERRAGHGG